MSKETVRNLRDMEKWTKMKRREMRHENKDYIQNGSEWYRWEIYRTFVLLIH